MQDLIVGAEYIAVLNNDYYENQSIHLKYIGLYDEEDEMVKRFIIMENKEWEGMGVIDGSGKWEKDAVAQLYVEGYTFEPYNLVLENE